MSTEIQLDAFVPMAGITACGRGWVGPKGRCRRASGLLAGGGKAVSKNQKKSKKLTNKQKFNARNKAKQLREERGLRPLKQGEGKSGAKATRAQPLVVAGFGAGKPKNFAGKGFGKK